MSNNLPPEAICFYPDGSEMCCVRGDFVDLQTSPAGFGLNFESAFESLKRSEEDAAKTHKGDNSGF